MTDKTISITSTSPNTHHMTDDERVKIIGEQEFDIKWMKAPPQLGGKKHNVIYKKTTTCKCGKHEAIIRVLDGLKDGKNICNLYCDSMKQYMWVLIPINEVMTKF